jgi:hypothetical protein
MKVYTSIILLLYVTSIRLLIVAPYPYPLTLTPNPNINLGSVCPATPIRTPLWKSERSTEILYPDSDNSTECSLYSIPKLMRQSSLTDNKVLLSLSDSISTSDVSFSRDFESEGFLGSGNFKLTIICATPPI